jgi:hypothetical protein
MTIFNKASYSGRDEWLTPVIQATQEAKIQYRAVQGFELRALCLLGRSSTT